MNVPEVENLQRLTIQIKKKRKKKFQPRSTNLYIIPSGFL